MQVLNGPDAYIKAGTKVIWMNNDSLKPHGIQALSSQTGQYFGTMESKSIPYGKTYEVTFDKPGSYDYTTTFQPHLMGKIVVS
jgi:plastocyanin